MIVSDQISCYGCNLGVVFDKKLNWNELTSHMIQKANTRLLFEKVEIFGVNTSLLITF